MRPCRLKRSRPGRRAYLSLPARGVPVFVHLPHRRSSRRPHDRPRPRPRPLPWPSPAHRGRSTRLRAPSRARRDQFLLESGIRSFPPGGLGACRAALTLLLTTAFEQGSPSRCRGSHLVEPGPHGVLLVSGSSATSASAVRSSPLLLGVFIVQDDRRIPSRRERGPRPGPAGVSSPNWWGDPKASGRAPFGAESVGVAAPPRKFPSSGAATSGSPKRARLTPTLSSFGDRSPAGRLRTRRRKQSLVRRVVHPRCHPIPAFARPV